jgi:hypothetical protein
MFAFIFEWDRRWAPIWGSAAAQNWENPLEKCPDRFI